MSATREMKIVDGKKLVHLRFCRGLTQKELARISGVNQSTVSKIERGEMGKNCKKSCLRIAKALNVEPHELAGNSTESIPSSRAKSRRNKNEDSPLVQALLKVHVAKNPSFGWADLAAARDAALATADHLNPGCNLEHVALTMLNAARKYRLDGGRPEGAVLAIVSQALYSLGATTR